MDAFEFDGKVGILRVAMNGKECKPMRFYKNLSVGTMPEKFLFSSIMKKKGAVEFTCRAKDMGEYLLYCGLTDSWK